MAETIGKYRALPPSVGRSYCRNGAVRPRFLNQLDFRKRLR